MPWQQITCHSDAEHYEALETQLFELGAVSVTLQDAQDQPLLEPGPGETPIWQEVVLKALFTEEQDIIAIQQAFPDNTIERIADQNWERAWLDQFQPMQFADNLWICPSEFTPPDPNAVNIFLDPGLAFGTGTHPTTALCLQWLAQEDLSHKTVIDYGCGSGILAIAAAKLGAKKVYCIDNDPQALVATADNAKRNHLDEQCIIPLAPADLPNQRVDLLKANILAKPLIELAPHFAHLLKRHGHIALSGILAEQAPAVRQAYAATFHMDAPVSQGDWYRLSGIKA